MKWTKECICCGNTFIAGRPNTKFCSRGCQRKAYQKKQKQKKIETPPIKMETIPIKKKDEFKVPEYLLKEFIDYMNSKGLGSTISSIKDKIYYVETTYCEEQTPIIKGMKEFFNSLNLLIAGSMGALALLADAAKKIRDKEEESFTTYLNTLVNNGNKK